MKHLKTRNQLNDASENLNISDVSGSKKIENVKVKHLIEYLNTLNPEAEVSLDNDDWDYDVDPITTIKKNGLFDYQEDFDEDGEDILFINN